MALTLDFLADGVFKAFAELVLLVARDDVIVRVAELQAVLAICGSTITRSADADTFLNNVGSSKLHLTTIR